jgi:hypothetical protein
VKSGVNNAMGKKEKKEHSFSSKETNKGSPPTPSSKKNGNESNVSISTCSKSVSGKDGHGGDKKKVSPARALIGLGDKVKSGVNSAMGKKEKKSNLVDKNSDSVLIGDQSDVNDGNIDTERKDGDEILVAESSPPEGNVSLTRSFDISGNDTLSISAGKEPKMSDDSLIPASLSDTREGAVVSAVNGIHNDETENPTNESHASMALRTAGCELTDEQSNKAEMNANEEFSSQVEASHVGLESIENVTFPAFRNDEHQKECKTECENSGVSDECPTSENGCFRNDVDIWGNTEKCPCNTSKLVSAGEERETSTYSTPDRKFHAGDAYIPCVEKACSRPGLELNICCMDEVAISVGSDLQDKTTFNNDTCNGQCCKSEYALEESTGEKETSNCEQAEDCNHAPSEKKFKNFIYWFYFDLLPA